MNLLIKDNKGEESISRLIDFLDLNHYDWAFQPNDGKPIVSGSLPTAHAKEFSEEIKYALSCYETYGTSDNKLFEDIEKITTKYCSMRQLTGNGWAFCCGDKPGCRKRGVQP